MHKRDALQDEGFHRIDSDGDTTLGVTGLQGLGVAEGGARGYHVTERTCIAHFNPLHLLRSVTHFCNRRKTYSEAVFNSNLYVLLHCYKKTISIYLYLTANNLLVRRTLQGAANSIYTCHCFFCNT